MINGSVTETAQEDVVAPSTKMVTTAADADATSKLAQARLAVENLSTLPDEIAVSIVAFLDRKSQVRLSRVSKKFNLFFNDGPAIETLFTHVFFGRNSEVLPIIEGKLKRLCIKSKEAAVDHAGRSFESTVFQAALFTHNVGLCEKLDTYFDKLNDGQTEKLRQFQEIFPEGFPKQKPYNFNKLIQAINDSCDEEVQTLLGNPLYSESPLGQAMNIFRKEFTDLAMKELFFNPKHLIKAFNLYNTQHPLWSFNQSSLFWCQVIGFSQRFLPAPYVCKLYSVRKEDFFNLQPSSGLGFDFGVYGRLWCPAASCGGKSAPRRESCAKDAAHLENFAKQTALELQKLQPQVPQAEQSVPGSDNPESVARTIL